MSNNKFLLFTLEYAPFKGGVSKYYQNLAANWPDDNFFVLADNSLGGKNTDKIKYCSLSFKHLRPRWLKAFFTLQSSIHRLGGNVHVIVGQILPLGLAAYFLSKFIKFKYSIVLHGLDFTLSTDTKKHKKIAGKILARAEKIICANSYTANLVKSFNPSLATKTFVSNPSIPPSFIRNPQRARELIEKYSLADKIVLFGLGRLVERKGFDMVIKSMPTVIGAAPQTTYVIGGTGPEEENLKKIASALPKETQKRIIFLGEISDIDYWAWLELCDIFIMTSRNIGGDFEGFGIVYLEANLAGKPVIAGDSGGVRDAVINNINGLLVDPEDTAAIARAIIELAGNAKLRQALGEQGKRRTVEIFNAKKQTEKIFNQLID